MSKKIKMPPNPKITNDLLENQQHANCIIVYNWEHINEIVNMQVIENSALLTEFKNDAQIGVWKRKKINQLLTK